MNLKVLHCLETIGPGGVEQRRLSMARYLDKTVYEQMLTCSQVIGDFDSRLRAEGMNVEVLGVMGTPFNWPYYRNLLRTIRRYNPAIIHGAVFEGVISAVVGGIIGRVPIIVIEETSEPANRSWRGHLLLKLLAKFADAVVATSPAVYDYLTGKVKIPKEKTHLILNGVEPLECPTEEERRTLRARYSINSGDYVIGTVGRMLDNHKLVSVLIKAFNVFAEGRAGVKLLLVGDGVDRKNLEALVVQLRLQGKVLFVGHQSKVRDFYAMMDTFALVPAREGFGLAAVEAMFMGLPVMASNVGGLARVVVDHETGLLVQAGDVTALANAMTWLYENRDRSKAMGNTGKLRAEQNYTARRYVNDLHLLYQQLIKQQQS